MEDKYLKTCSCGSGLIPTEIYDQYGWFVTYACEECIKERLDEFYDKPEELNFDNYTG